LFPPNNGSTFAMLGIHNTPWLLIWSRRFWAPSSIHGASLVFFLNQFLRIWLTMKFSPISSPPLWFSAPWPFVNKGHQTIRTSLWLNPKFCIQTILETPWKSKVQCIVKIHLVLPKTYAPWPTYNSLGQFPTCSQKHYRNMWLCAP